MTPWLSRITALMRHLLGETMGPWVALSLSLHAGLIVAVLPDRGNKEQSLAAGGAIAVEIVVVEGPDARVAAATGKTGDEGENGEKSDSRDPVRQPDRARTADRRTVQSAARGPDTEPDAEPADMPAPPSTSLTAKNPPSTAAPVILAPRPRPKPAPPPENNPRTATIGGDTASSDVGTTASAPPAGGSRGASPEAGNPKPVYPASARRRGRQGRVVLRVEVLPNGAAGDVAVDRSSGDASLDEAAVAAVRQWHFRPAQRGGIPVAAQVRVPVRFRLR